MAESKKQHARFTGFKYGVALPLITALTVSVSAAAAEKSECAAMSTVTTPATWRSDQWHGFTRRHFEFEGHKAWIVEPPAPAGDGRWSWCTVWPEAFVERVGIVELLKNGYYHTYIDVFSTAANPDGVATMFRYQQFLKKKLNISARAHLIGMSWGGFFALRYAETHPDLVATLYLDAPVCNAADPHPSAAERVKKISRCFNLDTDALRTSELNPLNNTLPLVAAGIPILALTGEADATVNVDTNINILERRIDKQGGRINIIRRPEWGHHPHGLDDPSPLLSFHQSFYSGKR